MWSIETILNLYDVVYNLLLENFINKNAVIKVIY